jgi:hypothetical protein
MDDRYSTKNLLVLRKLTRAVADHLRQQMREYLGTLAFLLRPRNLLGEFIQGGAKDSVPGADKAFRELQSLYAAIAVNKPFNLAPELAAPIEIMSVAPEITPYDYMHVAKTDKDNKPVAITCPLIWMLSYAGFSPRRLRELLADRARAADQLQEFIVHTLIMHQMITRQTVLTRMMNGLHFPITSVKRDEFFGLPIPYINCAVTTLRPPDAVIIESTEIAGTGVFEEVVNLEEIAQLRNPFKERLIEIVRSHGEDLMPKPGG